MNRHERLARELPGDLKDRAWELAGLPVAQVDLVVAGLRASHRAGRQYEQEMRRRNRGRPRDADEIAAGTGRLLGRMGRRGAGGDLDAAAALYDLTERQAPALLRLTVAGLRARGYSDAEIAAGLGVTRQAVSQRFPRQGALPETARAWQEVTSAMAARCQGRRRAAHPTVPAQQVGQP